MSKLKTKKFRRKAMKPTGIPSLKELEMLPDTFPVSNAETISDKLRSPNAEDREIGAIILANMAINEAFVSDLIKKKIIRVAAPLLVDKCPSVRHAIVGSLRNIACCNDYTVSEAMVEQDIMTCLVLLLEQYREPWAPAESAENKIDSKSEIFFEACNLLWTLCINSTMAVAIFNKKNLITILLPCLSIETYHIKIPLAVAQCLYTVSENNKAVTDILLQPLIFDELRALMALPPSETCEPKHMLLRTYVAGIANNMYNSNLANCMSDVMHSILKVVSSTLSEPISPMLEDLSNKIACERVGRPDKYHEETDLEVELTAVVKAEESLANILSAKLASLEIIGNIFESGADDASDYVSCSETSEEMEIDEVEDVNMFSTEFDTRLSEDMREMIVSDKIWDKVQAQIFLPTKEAEKIQSHPLATDCLNRLRNIHFTALICLNNMLPRLEIGDIGNPSELQDLWQNIANMLFRTDKSNTDQAEATSLCMYALLQKLASAGYTGRIRNMTDLDLDLLENVYTTYQDTHIKVHIIGCLGTFGKIFCQVKVPTSTGLIKKIGKFLLEITDSKNADLWLLAETIDAIIDVFSDDDVNPIAIEINLVENLTRLKNSYDRKFKSQRKNLGVRADVIRTAKENLRNFIKYKNDFNQKNK